MAQKYCYFKECTSRSDNTGRNFFNFPYRDPDRLLKWLDVTGCTKEELDRSARYVCDLHFDPKFFATCQRRKVLVGQAVPELNRGQSTEMNNGTAVADTTGHPIASDDDENVLEEEEHVYEEVEDDETNGEILINDDDVQYVEDQIDGILDDKEHEIVVEEEVNRISAKRVKPVGNLRVVSRQVVLDKLTQKRPPPDNIQPTPPTTYKSQPMKRPKTESEESSVTTNPPEISPSATIISIKGVQYVQMSKHVYLAEQQMARDEINYWKNLVRGLKQQLDDVEF